ncbi:MAG: corrinoid ABC transporter substrate-binding protein [Methanosaeta sp. PtaU1.Bin060]|nr:MAG: corrinoid ABC transporter substrate-binding protein [Methanosaeta sp. PtaU1.Bin060]
MRQNTGHETAGFTALLFLAAMLCAGVSTAQGPENEFGFILHILGNANLDDRIDESDINYIKYVISGAKPATNLTDANNDSKIDELDIEQIKAIIRGDENNITFIDSHNKTVSLKMPISRIVLFDAADAMQILGCQDLLVGVGESFKTYYPNRYPGFSKKPGVGLSDAEAVLKAQPDIIIGASSSLESQLPSEIKLKVVRFETWGGVVSGGSSGSDGQATVKDSIAIMGYLFNASEKAAEYLEWNTKYMDKISDRVSSIPEDEKVRVYVESTPESKNTLTSRTAVGKGHAANMLIEIAGGKNIFAGQGRIPMYKNTGREYGEIETEWVLGQNPEAIVGRAMGAGILAYEMDNSSRLEAYRNDIMGLPGFDKITAVKDNRVYIITNDGSLSPNYPSTTIYLAKCFYPDLFQDIDPIAVCQEYMDMMGLSLNVSQHSTFWYP